MVRDMGQNKKEILREQVSKLDDVLSKFEANFDCEKEIPNEYSFLSIVKEKLDNFANT